MKTTLAWIIAPLAGVTAFPAGSDLPIKQRDAPFGTLIRSCTVPGTVALTFDDGVGGFTPQILDILGQYGALATFFVNGYSADWNPDWVPTLKRAHAAGHQVASHTYAHVDLMTVTPAEQTEQMKLNEKTFTAAIGLIPTYMRAPYLSCDSACVTLMGTLGYRVIDTNLDTKDYMHQNDIKASEDRFDAGLEAGGNLVLAHDVHEKTVTDLTPHMLEVLKAKNLQAVTVGQCLGMTNASDWYRQPPPA